MPFRRNTTTTNDSTGTGEAWHISKGFSYTMVLVALNEIRSYETVAMYGVENMEDAYSFTPEQLTQHRVQALSRLASTLKQLMQNTEFAITKHKEEFKNLYLRLFNLCNKLGTTYTEIHDSRNNKTRIKIDEQKFQAMLERLSNIKASVYYPLNANNLIYRVNDEFDLNTLKEELTE